MQRKNPHSYSNINNICQGLFFVVEGFLAKNAQNLQFFINSRSWNCIQYIFIFRGAVYLIH